MKILTKEQYFEAENYLIKAERILSNTEMDSEATLLNKIWTYLRLRMQTLGINNNRKSKQLNSSQDNNEN
jgi:hypothetical protein